MIKRSAKYQIPLKISRLYPPQLDEPLHLLLHPVPLNIPSHFMIQLLEIVTEIAPHLPQNQEHPLHVLKTCQIAVITALPVAV